MDVLYGSASLFISSSGLFPENMSVNYEAIWKICDCWTSASKARSFKLFFGVCVTGSSLKQRVLNPDTEAAKWNSAIIVFSFPLTGACTPQLPMI